MSRAKLLLSVQQAAAALTLLVALRFAYVETRALLHGLDGSTTVGGSSSGEASAQRTARAPSSPAEMVNLAAQTRQEVLNQFSEELKSAVPSTPAAPAVQQRHIFVDFGPARSNVYIAGKLVGQTPFGGQISCVEGRGVEVVVLPEKGAPIKRTYECPSEGPPALPSAHADLPLGENVSNLKSSREQ